MFQNSNPVKTAWGSLRKGFVAVAVFSLFLNLLMLAGPLYMLQVYDRVLTSQNIDTLVALSVLLAGVFIVIACLDLMRMRILGRLAARFELSVGAPVLGAAMRRRVQGEAEAGENLVEDVNGFREFISGTTLTAFFDAPWIPIYLLVLYVLHPFLGLLGLAGALTLTLMALINNARARTPMQQAAQARGRTDALFRISDKNAELVHALGMKSDLVRRWTALQTDAHQHKTRAADRVASFSVLSKTIRMGLQSAVLGMGAALAVIGESTAGVMIAATIVLARALAPIDQLIGQWRTFLAARGSYRKIKKLTEDFAEAPPNLNLPRAFKSMDVRIAQAGPPLAINATIRAIDFSLKAGDILAVIGQSGSGKTTLGKMLAGIWHPQRGEVLLDGSPMSKWNPEDLGKQIGYLPQDVELFDGTIRENIARFSTAIDDAEVLRVAREAGVHKLVSGLPDGYETRIGRGFFLSGGQRQRLALARALYGDPFVLVLDEPNSDLDAEGEQALRDALLAVQERGGIAIVMTHRPATLQAANKVMVLRNGNQTQFGDKQDVLKVNRRNVLDKPTQPAPRQSDETQIIGAAL
ncbi:Type I secretion system ATP-binding protein PrsD [Ruegeria denitrificans]|uniref:Type I secretion system ATP-binding protein PrsD n=1 Tax=Ruegeria denitrificans TaxID=1715692 RepID=A0A0P1IIS8_9RHOB|nr:type I secretion system permease/ATPase [Ruegeria denitrificans]CUJ97305.1 Type I secretion system ATP-binding protein PrsD [Ruegeria denitrificans]